MAPSRARLSCLRPLRLSTLRLRWAREVIQDNPPPRPRSRGSYPDHTHKVPPAIRGNSVAGPGVTGPGHLWGTLVCRRRWGGLTLTPNMLLPNARGSLRRCVQLRKTGRAHAVLSRAWPRGRWQEHTGTTRARGPRRPERADAPRPAASGEVPAARPRSRTPALLLRRGPVSRHAKTNSNRPSTYVKTVESQNS